MKKKLILLSLVLILTYSVKGQINDDSTRTGDEPVKVKLDSVKIPVDADGHIVYEEVVKVDPTMKQLDLYKKSREWFVNTFVSSKAVIQLDDKAEGQIIGKGNADYSALFTNMVEETITCKFTVKIESKDGRYRYKIYDLTGSYDLPEKVVYYDNDYKSYLTGITPKINFTNRRYYKQNYGRLVGIDKQMKEIIASLEKAMRAPSSSGDF